MAHDHTPEIHEHADAWHHHTAAEGTPQHEHAAKVDSGALIKWFFGTTVLLVVVIVALKMYFTRYTTQMRALAVETLPVEAIKSAQNTMESRLGLDGKPFKYSVADKQAKTVQLPISEGIRRAVAQYQQGNK